jgi:hypothetical protein
VKRVTPRVTAVTAPAAISGPTADCLFRDTGR